MQNVHCALVLYIQSRNRGLHEPGALKPGKCSSPSVDTPADTCVHAHVSTRPAAEFRPLCTPDAAE